MTQFPKTTERQPQMQEAQRRKEAKDVSSQNNVLNTWTYHKQTAERQLKEKILNAARTKRGIIYRIQCNQSRPLAKS